MLPGAQDPVPGGWGPGAWAEVPPGDHQRVSGRVEDRVQARGQEQVHHRHGEGAQSGLRPGAQGEVRAGNNIAAVTSICSHK